MTGFAAADFRFEIPKRTFSDALCFKAQHEAVPYVRSQAPQNLGAEISISAP
jgi:hypothetical protein